MMQTQLMFQTLIELFNRSLGKIESLDKEYLEIIRTERREKLTFEQLKTNAQDFALWLIQSWDIHPKDKVAILGKNRTDWDIAFLGTILAGAVPVLIDPERPVEAVINHIIHTDTRILFMADDYQDADARKEIREFALSRHLGLIETTACREVAANNTQKSKLLSAIWPEVKADDTAVILCTSGTTGDPREVELTHANIIANIQGSLQRIKITSRDKLGHILPPHHSFGLTVGKLLPFTVGATNIYTNKYRRIPTLIKERQITIFVAIPALFTVLAKNIEDNLAKLKKEKKLIRLLDCYIPKLIGKRVKRELGWGKLRFFFSGAAPVPRWVLEGLFRRGFLLYEGYGTTENSPVYGFNDNPKKLGSVGKPISTLLVKIVNDTNEILPPCEKGEICLGGPCIMKGYYKNPQATDLVIKTDAEGIRWLHTGDLFTKNEKGYYYIVGRLKDMVRRSGENISAVEVEGVLCEHPAVRAAAVVPVPDELREEEVKAFIQLQPDEKADPLPGGKD